MCTHELCADSLFWTSKACRPLDLALGNMGTRVKNTATPDQLSRVMRAYHTEMGDAFRSANLEDVVSAYEDMMLEILTHTDRPNWKVLNDAAKKAYPKEKACDHDLFARQLSRAFQDCRGRSRSVTSGARTADAVLRVMKRMRSLSQGSKQAEEKTPPRRRLAKNPALPVTSESSTKPATPREQQVDSGERHLRAHGCAS